MRNSGRDKINVSDEEAKKILGEELYALLDGLDESGINKKERVRRFNIVIEKNRALVRVWAKIYAKSIKDRAIEKWDLEQEGVLGLMEGVRKFQKNYGCKLSVYVSWWIRQRILRCFQNSGNIRVPSYRYDDILKLNKMAGYLQQKYFRYPSEEELIQELGWDEEKLKKVMEARKIKNGTISFSTPLKSRKIKSDKDDSELTIGDLIADTVAETTEEKINLKDFIEMIEGMFAQANLKPRFRHCFWQYILEDRKLADIGREVGLSRERIRQMKDKAIKILKKPANNELLKDFASCTRAEQPHFLLSDYKINKNNSRQKEELATSNVKERLSLIKPLKITWNKKMKSGRKDASKKGIAAKTKKSIRRKASWKRKKVRKIKIKAVDSGFNKFLTPISKINIPSHKREEMRRIFGAHAFAINLPEFQCF